MNISASDDGKVSWTKEETAMTEREVVMSKGGSGAGGKDSYTKKRSM